MSPKLANSKNGKCHKDKYRYMYFDTNSKILTEEMLI